MPHVLALDIGTSSIRATVYASSLRPVRRGSQIHYRWRTGIDGSVEAPVAALERAVATAIDGALAGHRGAIDAVGIAAFWHSLVGTDAAGHAVTSVLPWTDTRSAAQADALRTEVDERAVHARTGCRLHSSSWPARFRWFAEHDRRTFARVRRWSSFPSYLERRWLGRDAESRSQASGTGLFSHEGSGWDAALCRVCRVDPGALASIVDLDDREGRLSASLSRRWPQLEHARWVPAAGDGAVNNVGAACAGKGRAAIMIGTSGALRQIVEVTSAPTVPFGLWRYWLDRHRAVVGGALSNGGNLIAWLHQILGLPAAPEDSRRLDVRIARLAPDAHQLTMLPFLAGERSPDYLPGAHATIAGLRLATTREEILRAGLEAVAYRFRAVLHELDKVGPSTRLVAAGTALASSRLWLQIVCDTLGRPVALPREAELTSRGAAILAFEQLGVKLPRLEPAIARIFEPDPRAHQIYAAAAKRQQALLDRLRDG